MNGDLLDFRDDQRARCKHVDDPSIFFPNGNDAALTKAKKVCQGCPLRQPCLNYALANDEDGVWGGTSERQRRQMRRVAARRLALVGAP